MISQHLKDCINHMTSEGLSVVQVARRLKTSETTVRRVLRNREYCPGEVIQALDSARARKGWTRVQLSVKAGYNARQWQDAVSGKHNPSFLCIENMAQALGYKLHIEARESQ